MTTDTSPLNEDPPVWPLGFLGFLSLIGVRGIEQHNALFLFWFAFAGSFSFFGYRWEKLKYLGLLGIPGFGVAVLALLGIFSI
ncbi:hypothetical protein [Halobellus inordinatus]|uniref:hypothetical protein n=1 Tax=Halobellus inordinatus TaxID=1126236 RepID=UPI00210C352F|nr:hypothetical protein [Halobellus inordinatus]